MKSTFRHGRSLCAVASSRTIALVQSSAAALKVYHIGGSSSVRFVAHSAKRWLATSDHSPKHPDPSRGLNDADGSSDESILTNAAAVNATTDWIPPQHALAGDKGQSYAYSHVEALRRTEPLPDDDDAAAVADMESETVSIDWLQTRRAVQGTTSMTPFTIGGSLLKPHQARAAKQQALDDIAVKRHMLLTRHEIVQVLELLGGLDIAVVLDTRRQQRQQQRASSSSSASSTLANQDAGAAAAAAAAAVGLVLVTGTSHAHLRSMAEALIRQLRRRQLDEVGVVGATLGADGNLKDPREHWMVVDCHNYVVHLQDAVTRTALDLKGLWSGTDGLHLIDMDNEDAVEDYVAAHPVPANYPSGGSGRLLDTAFSPSDWDDTLKQLEKKRWIAPLKQPQRPSALAAAPKRRRKTSGRKT
jgi:ribosomal silencing factor RsfS